MADRLDVTVQSALNYVRKLEELGIVIEVEGIAGRSKRWLALDVYRTLDPDDAANVDLN